MKVFAVAVVLSALPAAGQDKAASVQDQVLCDQQAQVVLKASGTYAYGYFPAWDSQNPRSVISHLDPKTGRCFAELRYNSTRQGKIEEMVVSIVNAPEGRRVAYLDYFVEPNTLFCWVEDEQCTGTGKSWGVPALSRWSDPGYEHPWDHFDALVKMHGMR
jgi:hypothetical protein